jgi:Uma2 family endonuclease
MHATARQHASYADIEALPPHVTGQIVDGELYVSPRPALSHARTASLLSYYVIGAYDVERPAPDGWWIYAEPELHLGDSVLVPDLAGWVRGRLSADPRAACTVAPDWICEILSPSTHRFDRGPKLFEYARHGVKHAWLVEPVACTVEVFTLRDGRWSYDGLHAGDALMRAEPFAELEIPLGRVWLQPEPAKDSDG